MVAYLARCLVEPDAPRPSIETLLHAFLPAAHVDHVHADAICALANAPDPEAAVHEALGDDVAVVAYLRPGFELSKRVAALAGRARRRARPPRPRDLGRDARGVVRAHAGARRARSRVPRRAARTSARLRGSRRSPQARCGCCRGSAAGSRGERQPGARRRPGPARVRRPRRRRRDRGRLRSTPDHMLRIGAPDRRAATATRRRASTPAAQGPCSCPGLGCVAAAPDARTARACGSSSRRTRTRRPRRRSTRSAAPRGSTSARWTTFENWPLELHKLTLAAAAARARRHDRDRHRRRVGHRPRGRPRPRRAAARTSSLADRRRQTGSPRPRPTPERTATVTGDLTDPRGRRRLVRAAVAELTAASTRSSSTPAPPRPGRSRELADEEWRRSLDVNLTAHVPAHEARLAGAARAGRSAAASSTSRRRTPSRPAPASARTRSRRPASCSSRRIAALEGGADGIRANVVNPDAVFGGSRLWSDELRAERAEAHGVPLDELERFYASRSLLGREVTAADVAEAVAFLVSDRSRATTGATITVDGGVPAALPALRSTMAATVETNAPRPRDSGRAPTAGRSRRRAASAGRQAGSSSSTATSRSLTPSGRPVRCCGSTRPGCSRA